MEDELASLERQCASKRAHLERLEASLVGLESAWADERAELDERIRRNTARAAALRWEWCARAHSHNAREVRAQLERRVHAWRGAVELDDVASLLFLRTHELAYW